MLRALSSVAGLWVAANLGWGGQSSVGIFMKFDADPGGAALEIMKKEANALLQATGISLDWRMAKENRGNEAFTRLVFLKFKGTCRAGAGEQPHDDFGSLGATQTLGSTKVSHGRVLPYSEVECDRIREALAFLGPGAGRDERQRALGLALGRVVAHELYHILARTTAHAAGGLAKASHSLTDLISPGWSGFADGDGCGMTRNEKSGAEERPTAPPAPKQ